MDDREKTLIKSENTKNLLDNPANASTDITEMQQSAIPESLRRMLLEQQQPMQKIAAEIKEIQQSAIPESLYSMLSEQRQSMQSISDSLINAPGYKFAYNLNNSLLASEPHVKALSSLAQSLSASFDRLLSPYQEVLEAFKQASPMLDWLRRIDYSSLASRIDFYQKRAKSSIWHENLREVYMQVLFDARWFPFVGLESKLKMVFAINDIIISTRERSKNRENRIDKVILSHYTDAEITKIRKRWWKNDEIAYSRKRVITQAINAYLRCEYEMTTIVLSTLWEDLITCKAWNIQFDQRSGGYNKVQDRMNALVKQNDYPAILNDFYDKMILDSCYSQKDAVDGIPNRHGSAHGWPPVKKRKKAAINAIMFTDFIIKLEPIVTEEINGQTQTALSQQG